jgi:hypothetical protein
MTVICKYSRYLVFIILFLYCRAHLFGANVGTTVTGWVLVLDIGKYGLPLAGVFGLIYCFVSKGWRSCDYCRRNDLRKGCILFRLHVFQ